MRKAAWNQLLLLCLCICLSAVLAGCSDSNGQEVSDGVESQAVAEASDTVSDDMADMDKELQEEQDVPQSSTDFVLEEQTLPDDMVVYDYSSMNNVLAAVVTVMKEEDVNRFYRDQSNEGMAVSYLYTYVNLFDSDTFEKAEMKGKSHDTYVCPDNAYLQQLLMYAFGDTVTVDDLKADGDLLLQKGDSFYVALGDIRPVSVDYAGIENEGFTDHTVYSFDYEIGLADGDTEDGIIQAKFQEAPEVKSGITLKAVAISTY